MLSDWIGHTLLPAPDRDLHITRNFMSTVRTTAAELRQDFTADCESRHDFLNSCRFARLHPLLKCLYPLGGPSAVTRHRSILQPLENRFRVSAHVIVRPNVKREFH